VVVPSCSDGVQYEEIYKEFLAADFLWKSYDGKGKVGPGFFLIFISSMPGMIGKVVRWDFF
jgi:hypothetical protein